MQTKKARCMYCELEELIPIKASILTHKCNECHKVWHKLRTRSSEFGEGVSVHDLVRWHIKEPQSCRECGSVKKLTIDRIKSGNNGGKYEIGNIQLLCYTCNCCMKIEASSVKDGVSDCLSKSCKACMVEKPLTTEFWHRASHKPKYKNISASMFQPQCKICRLKAFSEKYMSTHKPTRMKKIKHMDAYNKYHK